MRQWLQVKQILDIHSYPSMEDGQNLLSGVPPELINKTLNTELKFNPNYYRIWTSEEIEAAENQVEQEMEA